MSLEPADGNPAPYRCKHGCERDELIDRIAALTAEVARKDEALRAAKQFIENGVEGGFILMPDPDTPDTAHNTLPMIRTALEARND